MNEPSSETSQEPVDLTGRVLGDYQLLRRLGRGGMADVYLSKQQSLNRNVALKILRPDLAKDDSYVQRFRQEAQAAANLVQANIVQIYEVGQHEGFYFIAQEYIQGRNLKQYLGRYGAVETVMAINVLRQCAMALQKAGELQVIHRDIKPENIMLSTKGEVKVTDFGLARIQNNTDQALTQIGVTMGTPLYMSPEQIEGGDIDHRSDIYSLGVTAYHMLAGEPPFDGENALAIALKHVKDKAVDLADVRPDVPSELNKIISRMMAKKRRDRFTDAKQLLKELRKVKVDFDDDWEMIVEILTVAEAGSFAGSLSESQLAATRQLQTVMKGNVRSWWTSPFVLFSVVALTVLASIAGWMLADQNTPASLLNQDSLEVNEVPKMTTAMEQYRAAYWATDDLERERYWKAVEEYFPPENAPIELSNQTVFANRRAKERLGELYLKRGMTDEALEIYGEFVTYEELAQEFVVIGHAGQAIIFESMEPSRFPDGAKERATKLLDAIAGVGLKQNLLNEFMREGFVKAKASFEFETEEDSQPNESGN